MGNGDILSGMTEIHHAMLEAAILAPSPDNNQPWLFRIADDSIWVYMDPGRSLPSDEKSMFDMTAIGAAVENAIIAASHHGYLAEPVWQGFDGEQTSSDQPIVEIRLQPDAATPDPLQAVISNRCTCRKPYSADPLQANLLRQLEKSITSIPGVQVDWLTSGQDKAKFGKLIARTDSLRFRHRPFHDELFRQLRFTSHEAESSMDGLDVRTLDLPFGVAAVLRCLRSWNIMRVIHGLRLTPLLTAPSAGAVRKSGAIAVVSVPAASTKEFFHGGRAIERLWLAGAALDLSMHPLGSLPIFLLQSQPKPAFQPVIERTRRGIAELLPNLGNRVIQLALRVGFSDPPSERSRRRPVEHTLQ